MEQLENQVEQFLSGARAAKEQQAAEGAGSARQKARSAAAANNFGMDLPGAKESDGSVSARLGLEALNQASKNPSLMAEAMEQMQDPGRRCVASPTRARCRTCMPLSCFKTMIAP